MEMVPEIMSSVESLVDDNKNYMVNLKKFSNGGELAEMLDSNTLNHLLNNKRFNVALKLEVVPVKKSGPKKKKVAILYTINSFIYYTSFLSRAGIKMKKDNNSWQCMGLNPETDEVIDADGNTMYILIRRLEEFFKKLYVYDDATVKKVNIEKTNQLRRRTIMYSRNLMAALYNEEPVEPPMDQHYQEIYRELESFKTAVQKFKLFVSKRKYLKSESEDGEDREEYEVSDEGDRLTKKRAAAPSRVTKTTKSRSTNKVTTEMVNDMIDNELVA